MDKYFEAQGKTADGRPLIHLVEPGTGYGLGASAGLEKVASGEHMPEVLELVYSIQAQPDRLYLVNSALGAGEYVGFNLRGDWFTERGLLHEPPGWRDIPVWDVDRRRLAAAQTAYVPGWGDLAWGYPTFYNAHRFRHHQNKDPERAYGYVLGAFWDPRMHRVVLVSELVREMCARLGALDIYERIARGEFPDTSMGAKVPADRCSICNHVARTPADYCEHVRAGAPAPYGMRAILPDGRRCGVYNDYPRFFDDSYVFIGAERSAKVMSNVTSLVRGSKPYSARLYLPGGRAHDRGRQAVADVSAMPRPEQEARLALAVDDIERSGARESADGGVASRISQSLSTIPALDDKERRALRHAGEVERRRAAAKNHTQAEEVRFWDAREREGMRGVGVEQDHVDRALALLRQKIDALDTQKIGSLAKWATHTKQVPAPSTEQIALVRDHASRLHRVLPANIAETRDERTFWDLLGRLAHVGVVLRPEEFQRGALCSVLGERGAADEADALGRVFAPTPLDPECDSPWAPPSASGASVEMLRSLLGPLFQPVLQSRSFAPRAVVIRITHAPAPAPQLARTATADPLLNRVSQMYNYYRTGLLAHPPDWGYVPILTGERPSEKIASAADTVSTLLLHLAYWPSADIG